MPVGRSVDALGARRSRREVLVASGLGGSAVVSGCLSVAGDDEKPSDTTGLDGDDGLGGADATMDDDDAARDPIQPIEIDIDEPTAEATVSMLGDHGNRFTPQLVWVAAGGRVVWHNDDPDHDHDVASIHGRVPESASSWSTGLLQTGETYTRTFVEPGVYDYICTPHGSRMVGRVVVGDPDPDTEPALSAGDDELTSGEAHAVFAVLDDRTEALIGDGRSEVADESDCDCPE